MGDGPLWYGEANSIQQSYLAARQRDNAPGHNKLLRIVAGTTLFQKFTTFVILDGQMRQYDYISRAKEFHTLL